MRNGALHVAMALSSIATWLHGQSAPGIAKAVEVRRLVTALRGDATWERASARLVRLGRVAAAPLGQALRELAKEDDTELQSARILRVLERLGLEGGGATEHVWQAMRVLAHENTGLALFALTRISPVGGPDRQQELMTTFRRLFGRDGQGAASRHFIKHFNTSAAMLAAKVAIKPDLSLAALRAELRKNRSHQRDAYCQMLGARGATAKPAAAQLGKWLRTYLRAGGHARRMRRTPEPQRISFALYACDAILRIDPSGEPAALARGYLIYAEPFRGLRHHAARELVLMGPTVTAAVPALVQFLRRGSEDQELVRLVLNCLAVAGAPARAANAEVEALTESKDPKTAARARSLLARLAAAKRN